MKNFKLLFAIAVLILGYTSATFADSSISISKGNSYNDDKSDYYRLSYQYFLESETNKRKWFSSGFKREIYIDYAVSSWEANYRPSDGSVYELEAISVSPVLRFVSDYNVLSITPFVDIGVGVAYLNEESFLERELDQRLQFESRIGFGMSYNNQSLLFNGFHYSNAGIGDHNDGTDWIVGTYSIRF